MQLTQIDFIRLFHAQSSWTKTGNHPLKWLRADGCG